MVGFGNTRSVASAFSPIPTVKFKVSLTVPQPLLTVATANAGPFVPNDWTVLVPVALPPLLKDQLTLDAFVVALN